MNLIASRLKTDKPSAKMAEMAKKSAAGSLTSFSGLFQMVELSPQEKANLEEILRVYAKNEDVVSPEDLTTLAALTSEIKAINHQAVLLHGDRIKKAHELLIAYKEGAFSAWLISAYGNRQTPYNFLQYYDFYHALPQGVKSKAEEMPRQALYTLASREGDLNQKIEFVTCYRGETKAELLIKIRHLFPLKETDRRKENSGDKAIYELEKICRLLEGTRLNKTQKEALNELIVKISAFI